MAIRNIVKDGDDILVKKCRNVVKFDKKLHTLLDDMAETMHRANGVGLAAPQVGILRQIAVINVDGENSYVFINPEIIEQEGEQTGDEGCLSVPGKVACVTRPEKVTAEALDRDGKPFVITGEGLLARCICHECDHLDGILYADLATEGLVDNEELYGEEEE